MIMEASSGALSGENIELTDHSSFRTNSGGIRMHLRNNVDQLSFDLSASSGGLSIGNQRMKKSYYSDKGSIKVKGVSSSGSQRYYNN